MRALPVHQPWASLLAITVKRVDTRGYPPSRLRLRQGERIAIHATKNTSGLVFCSRPHFRDHVPDPAVLPVGALLATCTLARTSRITTRSAGLLLERNPKEHAFGDYTPGRWAWVLTDVELLVAPVPFRGSRGTFDAPDRLLAGDRPTCGAVR